MPPFDGLSVLIGSSGGKLTGHTRVCDHKRGVSNITGYRHLEIISTQTNRRTDGWMDVLTDGQRETNRQTER